MAGEREGGGGRDCVPPESVYINTLGSYSNLCSTIPTARVECVQYSVLSIQSTVPWYPVVLCVRSLRAGNNIQGEGSSMRICLASTHPRDAPNNTGETDLQRPIIGYNNSRGTHFTIDERDCKLSIDEAPCCPPPRPPCRVASGLACLRA